MGNTMSDVLLFFRFCSPSCCFSSQTVDTSLFLLPLDADSPPRTFSCTSVCTGSLPSHRQTTTMSEPTITTDFHQPSNVHRHLAAQVSLHPVLALDHLAEFADLGFSEVPNSRRWINSSLLQDLPTAGRSDSINIREPNIYTLVAREIDTCYSCQTSHLHSALTLLMLGIDADHPYDALSPNYLALVAYFLYGCSDFHRLPPSAPSPFDQTYPRRRFCIINEVARIGQPIISLIAMFSKRNVFALTQCEDVRTL